MIAFDDWAPIEAQRTGNGAVFVTLHFGNWDLAGAMLAQRWPMTAIADTFGNPAVDRLVVSARRRLGMHIVSAGRTGPEVLRALRRNDVLAVLADVPQPGGGVTVNFFGAPFEMPDGPARIALRVGAPVIVGGVWRTRPTEARYEAAAEVVRFQPTGDREQDVRALTQATAHALERLVRRAPEQWYVFRSLWLDAASGSRARLDVEGAPASTSPR
ncbi:MAG: lysophospholipid acyltransferase family protein [Dehalococcoidia bacterium]